MDCGVFPKQLPKHFCHWCQLKRQPMHDQADAARARLEAVPEAIRAKRSHKFIKEDTPDGMAFCAGCQSFCPSWYFGSSATQCRACTSAKSHAARTEKVYGIDAAEYERLLEVQGGRCAICRNKPQSVRLAVDHSHKTGSVRGLACSRCNHEALGALHDEPQGAWNAYLYLTAPPSMLTDGTSWEEFLEAHPMPDPSVVKAEPEAPAKPAFSKPSDGDYFLPTREDEDKKPALPDGDKCTKGQHYLPVGAIPVPDKRGLWQVFASTDPDTDAPF